jgi:hypothetical protein
MTTPATIAAQKRYADEDLMDELRRLQGATVNRVTTSLDRPVTLASALAMKAYFGRCPLKPAAAPYHPDRPARLTRAFGDPQHTEEAIVRSGEPVRQPGPRTPVREPGYFEHNGRLFKVVRSVYGAHPGALYAKVLDPATGDWNRVVGMVSKLAEEERLSPGRDTEIGRLLATDPGSKLYGRCWICGRTLTDEESLRLGRGPGPHKGYDC